MKNILAIVLFAVTAIAQSMGPGIGVGPGIGIGQGTGSGPPPPTGDFYQSYGAGTQVHVSGNHWGNSVGTHMLLDTATFQTSFVVSRATWNTLSDYTDTTSRVNSYDVGLQCIAGACDIGKLYTHTGPLLPSQSNPTSNTQVSFPLVADVNTVCASYPCTIPAGTYSVTTGSSELPSLTMTIWSDGSTRNSGGAEFHISNSFGNPASQLYISGSVAGGGTSSATVSGNTQVTATVTMTNGQNTNGGNQGGFDAGMKVLVAGLTSGTGGTGDACNGLKTVDAVTSGTPGTIKFTVSGIHTCLVDTALGTAAMCNNVGGAGAGVGCIGAGLMPMIQVLIADQGNGYYCYADGVECGRTDFVGPAGTQTGAHSTGFIFFNP